MITHRGALAGCRSTVPSGSAISTNLPPSFPPSSRGFRPPSTHTSQGHPFGVESRKYGAALSTGEEPWGRFLREALRPDRRRRPRPCRGQYQNNFTPASGRPTVMKRLSTVACLSYSATGRSPRGAKEPAKQLDRGTSNTPHFGQGAASPPWDPVYQISSSVRGPHARAGVKGNNDGCNA
jgi:hypothetical protein